MSKRMIRRIAIVAGTVAALAVLQPPAVSWAAGTGHSQNILTLEHLKNANYNIPDLSCGYTPVQLADGNGENEGVQVVFGQAVFGKLAGEKRQTAVVHLAYRTEELGWLQELVFVRNQNGKLVQVAEYPLDDRLQLKAMSIKSGELIVETANNGESSDSRLTKIRVADTQQGCMLEVSEWQKDAVSGELVADTNISPYLSSVEERIGKCWSPTRKDRGEHVSVAFTIRPSGDLADVHVSNSSEVATADQAAIEAVQQAAPFPPLPDRSGEPLSVGLEFQAGVSVKR